MTVKGLTTPYRVGCEDLFICVGARDSCVPTRLIPWFTKTEGNTYATVLEEERVMQHSSVSISLSF